MGFIGRSRARSPNCLNPQGPCSTYIVPQLLLWFEAKRGNAFAEATSSPKATFMVNAHDRNISAPGVFVGILVVLFGMHLRPWSAICSGWRTRSRRPELARATTPGHGRLCFFMVVGKHFTFFAYCGLVGNPHLAAKTCFLLPFQRQPRFVHGRFEAKGSNHKAAVEVAGVSLTGLEVTWPDFS